MIIPSIDLMNGKAVQLIRGKEKALEENNAIGLAKEFSKYGEIAVVDLDSAFGQGNNLELVKKICKIADCRVGGGIRTIDSAKKILKFGAKKIIIGTKANKEFLGQLPKKRTIVAVDAKENQVMVEGWKKTTGKTPQETIRELEDYCSEFLFTNIEREGLMQGIDFEKIEEIKKATSNKLTVAGGITTIDEIKKLEDLGVNPQVGMALYTRKIDLKKAFSALLDFEKNKGLIPTIVQDENRQVLMLAFSTKKSLSNAFELGKGTYYSRSKGKIWTKGEQSGNQQELIKARYDCDRDALLFTVKQKNAACHNENYSCFGEQDFSFSGLYETLVQRVKNPVENSYTSGISRNEQTIREKIIEESKELANYKDKENLVWEIADLAYFTMVLMAKNNVTISDVKNELWGRKK